MLEFAPVLVPVPQVLPLALKRPKDGFASKINAAGLSPQRVFEWFFWGGVFGYYGGAAHVRTVPTAAIGMVTKGHGN